MSTPARPFKSFNLLPLCRSGRVFLKLNTESIFDLGVKAGVLRPIRPAPVPPDSNRSDEETKELEAINKKAAYEAGACQVIALFDKKKLQRLLRHPEKSTDKTRELILGGEFLRTDGVQIQFYCGLKSGTKRARDGSDLTEDDDEGETAAKPETGVNEDPESDEADVVSSNSPVPCDFEHLFACDPGKTNLYTVVKARLVSETERITKFPDLEALGDGMYQVAPTAPGNS